MRYHTFPIINTIDDVLPALAGRDEFIVAEREWGTVIDYQITLPDSFPCPVNDAQTFKEQTHYMIRRECRGLKFDRNGNLLARPFHKFFNLGERPETSDKELSQDGRFHHDFTIMPKLDGSMIHPMVIDGQMAFCTRMGITDVSLMADQYIRHGEHDIAYMDFCMDMCNSGMTPIFEWCSRKQRIVLDYPQDQLVLTAIRKNSCGSYLSRANIQHITEQYKIPLIDLYDGSWDGIAEFQHTVKNLENAEGYVLRWNDGHMVKMKGEWYVAIHRAKDSIAHEKRIIGLILNDALDDVLPHLLPQDFQRLEQYREDFWKSVDDNAQTLRNVVNIAREFTDATDMDEKIAKGFFAKNTVSNYTGDLAAWKGLLFSVWDGADPRDCVIKNLRKKFSLDVDNSKTNGSQAVVDELRAARMLPEKRWEEY